jgi:hypothetical protein
LSTNRTVQRHSTPTSQVIEDLIIVASQCYSRLSASLSTNTPLSTVLILPYQTHTHTHKDQTTNITTTDQTMQYCLIHGIDFRLPHPISIEGPKSLASHPTWVARKQLVRDEWKAREEANEAMLEASPPASKHGRLLSVATWHYINCLRVDMGATLDHDDLTNEDFRSTLPPAMLATAPPAIKGTWNHIKEAHRFFKKTRQERAALHLPVPPRGATSCSCKCCSTCERASKKRKQIKWQARLLKDQEKAEKKWKFKHNVGMNMLIWKLLGEVAEEKKEEEKKEEKKKEKEKEKEKEKKHTP